MVNEELYNEPGIHEEPEEESLKKVAELCAKWAGEAAIDKLEHPMGGRMNLPLALEAALGTLDQGRNTNREIVLFTDGQRNGWQVDNDETWRFLARRLSALPVPPRVLVRRLPGPSIVRNVTLADLAFSRSVIGTDREVGITALRWMIGEKYPSTNREPISRAMSTPREWERTSVTTMSSTAASRRIPGTALTVLKIQSRKKACPACTAAAQKRSKPALNSSTSRT
jgi:hypothetical protein